MILRKPTEFHFTFRSVGTRNFTSYEHNTRWDNDQVDVWTDGACRGEGFANPNTT